MEQWQTQPGATASDDQQVYSGLACRGCNRPIADEYYRVGGQNCCGQCALRLRQFELWCQPTPEAWLRALASGLAAAIALAFAWAWLAKATNTEAGLLALVIGIAVGKAVVAGAGFRRGPWLQGMGMMLAAFSVAAGKGLIPAWAFWEGGDWPTRVQHFIAGIVQFRAFDVLWYAIAVYEAYRMARMPRISVQGPFFLTAPAGAPMWATPVASSATASAPAPLNYASPQPQPQGMSAAEGGDNWPRAVLKTGGSMLVSILFYHWMLIPDWWFAIGFVVLTLVHELGHVVAIRWWGLSASAPLFVPMMGAVINLRKNPPNAFAEAVIGIAGPLAGTLGAVACYLVWFYTGSLLALSLGMFSAYLNLFNLLPLPPMDGGRTMAAVSPWVWMLGVAGAVKIAWDDYHHGHRSTAQFMVLILLVALPRVLSTLSDRRARGEYYRVSRGQRWAIAALYLALGGGLYLLLLACQRQLPF